MQKLNDLLIKESFKVFLLFLVALFLFSWKIGSIQIIDGDTGFYATIARNIIHSGDWLTLRFLSPSDIIDKPPLFMWFSAVSFMIFGVNEFALSFWHSILAALSVVLTYLLGRDLFSKRAGMISASVLLTTSMFFYLGRTPLQDMPVTFFILATMYLFARYDRTRNFAYFYGSAATAALAVMMKGPMGLAIPAVAIVLYLIIAHRGLFEKPYQYFVHILLGAALFLFIAAPWFTAEYLILGRKFADVFIGHNFGRFLNPTDKLPGSTTGPQYDFYSYPLQILLLFAPWSGFIYPALFYAFKRDDGKRELKFILLYALTAFLFFSLSLNFKISRYILPAFPPLAILVGVLIGDALKRKDEISQKFLRISTYLNLFFVSPLLLLATVWLALKFPAAQSGYQPIILPFLAAFTATLVVSSIWMLRKTGAGFKAMLVGAYISYLIFILCAAIFFSNADPVKDYSLRLKGVMSAGGAAVKYKGEAPRSEYFYAGTGLQYITDPKDLAKLTKTGKPLMGIATDINDLKTFEKTYRLKLAVLDERGGYILFSKETK